MRLRITVLVTVLLALAAWALPGAASAAAKGADRLELVSQRELDGRLVELALRTPALTQDPTRVRVLLPAGYRKSSTRRYPVLYLLHGGLGSYLDWTTVGNARQATAGLPLIVVMPDAGRGGWYTDWYNRGALGTPRWETYHVDQLIPWIDSRFRTVANRRGRAIAGLSMGGFGALSYAARHPDRFVYAAGFSGAVDVNEPDPFAASSLIDAISALDGGKPGSLFGLRQTDDVRWRAHNPWDLARNLRGLSLALRTGNGQPGGPFGGGGPGEILEGPIRLQNVSLHRRLTRLGIPHVWDDYGPGGHLWPYWNRGLERTLPSIMATFARRPRPPSPFTFTAVEPVYRVYGWRVAIKRRTLEFSKLSSAGARGFVVSGSGVATVTTARLYTPGRRYAITARGSFGILRRFRRAGHDRRLRVRVALGRSNPVQQQLTPVAGQPRPTTRVFTSRVAISRVRS